MGYSKRQFIQGAYDEIGLGTYALDLTPEQMQRAVRRLDAMMADWSGRGVIISYPLPGSPQNSDLDAETNAPDWANNAILLGLGIQLAASEGKTLAPDTRINFANAFNTVVARCVKHPQMQYPAGTPAGAGNRMYYPYPNTFLIPPVETEVGLPEPDIDFAT